MRRRLTQQQVQRAQRLHDNGISTQDIAKTLGLPIQLITITITSERTGNDQQHMRRMRQTNHQQTLL